MIDTIGIYSPGISAETYEKVKQFCIRREGLEIASGEIVYQFTSGQLEGSYDSKISIQLKSEKYIYEEADSSIIIGDYEWVIENGERKAIRVGEHKIDAPFGKRVVWGAPYIYAEASVHKLMLGHNIYGGPENFQECCFFLVYFLERIMGVELPDYSEWFVKRVDVAECWNLGSFEACCAWFHGMKHADYPRRTVQRYGSSGLYSPGRATTVKFYHKGPEFFKHDRRRLKNRSDIDCEELQKIANCVIRAEVEIKARKLRNDMAKKHYDILVKNISDEYLKSVFDDEVQKILREGEKGMEIARTHDKVEARLLEKFNKRSFNTLYGFWLRLSVHGEEEVKRRTKKSTFYRLRKKLIDAGISWHNTDMVLEEVETAVPSDFQLVRGNVYHMVTPAIDIDRKMVSVLLAM
jgi:II/X family phage/plasmid replication protein